MLFEQEIKALKICAFCFDFKFVPPLNYINQASTCIGLGILRDQFRHRRNICLQLTDESVRSMLLTLILATPKLSLLIPK